MITLQLSGRRLKVAKPFALVHAGHDRLRRLGHNFCSTSHHILSMGSLSVPTADLSRAGISCYSDRGAPVTPKPKRLGVTVNVLRRASAPKSLTLCLEGSETMKQLFCQMCLAVLLSSHAWARDASTVNVEVLVKTTSSWDGKTLPKYPQGKPEITILRITIPPKVQLPQHEHPVINAGVLLKGELTVIAEDKKELHLRAGDSIVEVLNKRHYGKNEGDEPAEIIVFYAGIQGTAITIEENSKK
jgi:quercetin dioxygenase-like cupin family protein